MSAGQQTGKKLPTPAQARALNEISAGMVRCLYTEEGRGVFAIYAAGLRIDVLERVIDAGWAKVSRERRPYSQYFVSDWKEVADVELTEAGVYALERVR